MSSGAMQSKVGNPQVYNDGDQKYAPLSPYRIVPTLTLHITSGKNADAPGRFEHGQKNAHDLHDSK